MDLTVKIILMFIGGVSTSIIASSLSNPLRVEGIMLGILFMVYPYFFTNTVHKSLSALGGIKEVIAKTKRDVIVFTLIGVLIGAVVYLLFSL